eukprot:4843560-Ditylum_brightwellii.AAC.2
MDRHFMAVRTCADLVGLATTKKNVLHEPKNLMPEFPNIRPLDFTFQTNNGLFSLNITLTLSGLFAKRPYQQEQHIATLHHQKEKENGGEYPE